MDWQDECTQNCKKGQQQQWQLQIVCKVSISPANKRKGNCELTNMKRALGTLTAIMTVAAGTTKLTCNHDTLPPQAIPANAVAACGTGKHTNDLAKIGPLVCRPDSVELTARLQGWDSKHGGQGVKVADCGC